ncbi:unnamed protein product [Merluccius merluccius]
MKRHRKPVQLAPRGHRRALCVPDKRDPACIVSAAAKTAQREGRSVLRVTAAAAATAATRSKQDQPPAKSASAPQRRQPPSLSSAPSGQPLWRYNGACDGGPLCRCAAVPGDKREDMDRGPV